MGTALRWRRWFTWVVVCFLVALATAGSWVLLEVRAFDASMQHVYDVPISPLVTPTDPATIARGEHLAHSIASCATSECHGTDLSGGTPLHLGAIGTVVGPNITPWPHSALANYGDGELVRLVQHGIKRDGRSLRFMPSHEIGWLPNSDVAAIVSYLRTVPPIEKPSGEIRLGIFAKVLDRQGKIVVDVARRIDHGRPVDAPLVPEPTARYGAYLARGCSPCHGERFSGGPLPGAPASMVVPANLTPHASGLATWTFEDFSRVLDTGIRPDGRKLSPEMPYEGLSRYNRVERTALWTYLQSLPPVPFGNR